jgi:hypothetical protein
MSLRSSKTARFSAKGFSRKELRFLRDIREARRLVGRHFDGGDSDALCDAMHDALEALDSILKGLRPLGDD